MSLLRGEMVSVWKCLAAFHPKVWIMEGGCTLYFRNYFSDIA